MVVGRDDTCDIECILFLKRMAKIDLITVFYEQLGNHLNGNSEGIESTVTLLSAFRKMAFVTCHYLNKKIYSIALTA